MNQILYGFLLSSLAGLSTLLGMVIIIFKNKNNIINITLLFTSFIMIYVSIFDLIPASLDLITNYKILIITLSLSIGMILTSLIDKNVNYTDSLYRLGIISMLAIIMHNIPEGIVSFLSANKDINLGIRLALAISLHNIPEGISISILIYSSTKSFKKTFLYVFLAAISEPFGALIGYLLLPVNNCFLGVLFALTAGIMIYISLFEIIPEIKNNKLYIK